VIKDFIEEYKNAYLVEFEDGFWGKFDQFAAILSDPKNHPSIYLKNRLDALKSLKNKPLNIAVVGQFSSGKSTFLNTLLKSEILPTGVIPVTAKVTKIEYAPFCMLKITQTDGSDEIKGVDELKNYTDQRQNLKDVKSLTIYNDSEILKIASFSDTPGLNSRSKADTKETMEVLKNADGLFWISLIDNAARASEKDDIFALPAYLKRNSLCLLSQKDRLNNDEISRVLNHAKSTFEGAFSDILAISSKLENEGNKESGFSEIYAFLERLNSQKERVVTEKSLEIVEVLKDERKFYIELYAKLYAILTKNEQESNENALFSEYSDEFSKIYARIKELCSDIATIFMSAVSSQKSEYFTKELQSAPKEKGFLTKFAKPQSTYGYVKNEYDKPFFNKDAALSKLIYNDDNLATIFRRLKTRLNKFEQQIREEILQNYHNLENEILLFKGEFESLIKQNELHSVDEIAHCAKIAGEVYELFLKNYEREYFKFSQNLALFFEKINIKIINNYRNAVKLSADFIGDKVLKSIEDYESDPITFSLFYPKFEDFNHAMLQNLQYFEFEDEFIGEKSFIKKSISSLLNAKSEILNANLAHINELKSRHESILSELENLETIFE